MNLLASPIIPFSIYWFLYALFFSFLLYYGLAKLLSAKSIFVISVILYFVAPFIDFWIAPIVGRLFVYFALGSLLHQSYNLGYLTKINSKKMLIYLLLAAFVFSIISIVYVQLNFSKLTYAAYVLKGILGISGIILIAILSIIMSHFNGMKIIDWLGNISLVIYVAHLLPQAGARIVLMKFMHITDPTIHTVFGVLIGLIFPVILYKLSKRYNFYSILFGFKVAKK
jgi:fucose 4-O-acetylase-like acetyltransferase